MFASSRGESDRESTSRTAAVPRDGSSRFMRILIVVVFPAPIGAGERKGASLGDPELQPLKRIETPVSLPQIVDPDDHFRLTSRLLDRAPPSLAHRVSIASRTSCSWT